MVNQNKKPSLKIIGFPNSQIAKFRKASSDFEIKIFCIKHIRISVNLQYQATRISVSF